MGLNKPTSPRMNKFIASCTSVGGILVTSGLVLDKHTITDHPLAVIGIGTIVIGSLIGILKE